MVFPKSPLPPGAPRGEGEPEDVGVRGAKAPRTPTPPMKDQEFRKSRLTLEKP